MGKVRMLAIVGGAAVVAGVVNHELGDPRPRQKAHQCLSKADEALRNGNSDAARGIAAELREYVRRVQGPDKVVPFLVWLDIRALIIIHPDRNRHRRWLIR